MQLPALLDAYSQLVDQAASTPLRHRAALEEIEKRWIDITRIKVSLFRVSHITIVIRHADSLMRVTELTRSSCQAIG